MMSVTLCSCSCDNSTVRTEEKLLNRWSAKLHATCVSWTNWKGDSRLRRIGAVMVSSGTNK